MIAAAARTADWTRLSDPVKPRAQTFEVILAWRRGLPATYRVGIKCAMITAKAGEDRLSMGT